MTRLSVAPLTHFASPDDTTAPAPPEERGVARDEVRMLVATDEGVAHARFRDLPAYLAPGDLVVVNNSATLAAEFDALLRGRGPVVVHAATRLDDGTWVVELRTAPDASRAVLDAQVGDELELPASGRLTLLAPYPRADSSPTGSGNRLWRAAVSGPRPLEQHLVRYGRPIAYGYLDRSYPLAAYQTVFATRPGSAEMPSAARPFSQELVTRLVATGIGVAAVTLHTGVSSQEAGEAPQPEWFEVSATVADWSTPPGRRVDASWPSVRQ
ncbi:MAG: S-adenosylmethionine:tRNA ribosyltransferase-isomerase [Pedococcus sp.]